MSFWDLLFPPRCPFCRRVLARQADAPCPDCQNTLPWLTERTAEVEGEFFTRCVAPLRYQDTVRQAIHRYKFDGVYRYASAFGPLMAQCVSDHGLAADVVSWVPLSRKRLRHRGYDQAKLLAEEVAKRLGLPLEQLLEKSRHVTAQSGLKEESARRANVLGAFSVPSDAKMVGKRILLVDDVVTTGATLSECARVLCTGGAEEVVCVVLARAR